MALVSESSVPVPANGSSPAREEPVDEIVVVADEPRAVELASPQRTAAVAASGFAAGVATMALMRRRSVRRARRRAPKGVANLLPIVGSRSFLVDVHLIGRD